MDYSNYSGAITTGDEIIFKKIKIASIVADALRFRPRENIKHNSNVAA